MSVNKVFLLGRIGNDPEVRSTPNGALVANLSLATSEKWTDKQTGQRQEKTEWHKLVAFNKTAEIIQNYVKKGDQIFIEGSIETKKWQDQNGQDRYTTQIKIMNLQMLGSPNANAGAHPQQGGYQQQPQTQYQQATQQRQPVQQQRPQVQNPAGYPYNQGFSQPQQYQQAPAQQTQQQDMQDYDDDIPF